MVKIWMAALAALAALIPALPVTAAAAAAASAGEGHATVFVYHRFGESHAPATNIRLAQFEAHLAYLETGGYGVWPLSRIVTALRQGQPIPDRTVALTADDAYLSVMVEAWPRVRRRGWTMTLFVATDGVDLGYRGYLDWAQIRRLREEGMEIGLHSAAHAHMAEMSPEAARADLARGADRFVEALGFRPDLLAWPYGEASLRLIDLAREMGFRAAFGQHSGPLSAQDNPFYLPRFAMNETYGRPARFQGLVDSLPLPVSALAPAELMLAEGTRAEFAFTLGGDLAPERVQCFHSAAAAPQPLRIEGRRIFFQPAAAARPGRSRYNCTAPAGGGRFYWHGRQFVTPGGRD